MEGSSGPPLAGDGFLSNWAIQLHERLWDVEAEILGYQCAFLGAGAFDGNKTPCQLRWESETDEQRDGGNRG